MEPERKHESKINNSDQLNKMLTGVLMQMRRGEVPLDMARHITLIADKINKNNVNQIEYKKISKHERDLPFFDEDL